MTARRRLTALAALSLPLAILPGSCLPQANSPATAETTAQPMTLAQTAPPSIAPLPAPDRAPPPAIALDSAAARQGQLLRGRIDQPDATLTLDDNPVPVAADGQFLIAFDRDAPAEQRLVAIGRTGLRQEQRIAVAPGQWRIEHINARMTGGAATTEEFRRRRAGELAQIAAARATPVESEGWRQSFIWPVQGRISGLFGSQRVYQGQPGSYHSGVDVAPGAGVPFVAPADGVVTLAAAAPFTLEGLLLIVDHGMGLSSAFLHNSRLDVAVGDRVVQGQRLGRVGATGRATGPHLHWAMKWRDTRIDPARVAGPMRTAAASQ